MDAPTAWWNAPIFAGFTVTPLRIVLAIVLIVVGWVISSGVQRLIGRKTAGRHVDPGARYSLGRLLHYGIVTVTLIVGLTVVGLDLRSVAVVVGALGIGVGLGLQSITANFVSGLILLFERPIRPGDRVSLGTSEQDAIGQVNGYVKAIRLRSTTIQTLDNILLIVPNADLVGRTIVNWSHGDPRMRIRLGVGVAYASDLEAVRQVMMAAAYAHTGTLKEPAPEVRLVGTSDASLDFQLLVWIPDPRERGRVESDLRLDIVQRFRAEGITIPFPQREVRILGVEPTTALAPGEPVQSHEG